MGNYTGWGITRVGDLCTPYLCGLPPPPPPRHIAKPGPELLSPPPRSTCLVSPRKLCSPTKPRENRLGPFSATSLLTVRSIPYSVRVSVRNINDGGPFHSQLDSAASRSRLALQVAAAVPVDLRTYLTGDRSSSASHPRACLFFTWPFLTCFPFLE
jgi:hypothetical protein